MTAEQEIKQFVMQQGADIVRIASVADINKYAPLGYRPDDILTGAKSVIVFSKQPIQGAWHSPNYRTPYHTQIWGIISGISYAIAGFIESKYGYYSLDAIPNISLYPGLSQKLCAEMAGLGTRAMAGAVVLNPELGLLTIGTCLTTMPLAADGPMKEPVCPHPSCVKLWEKQRTTPCLMACPECLSGELEGLRIKWMRYDRRVCSTRAMTEGMSALLRTLADGMNEPDPEVRRMRFLGSFSQRMLWGIAYGTVYAQCFECLRHCPVYQRGRMIRVKTPIGERPAEKNISEGI